MNRHIRIILVALLAGNLFTACKNDGYCNSDKECGNDQLYCLNHLCTPKTVNNFECTYNRDCPKDTDVCINHVCYDSTRANFCKNNNNCPNGRYCRKSVGDCVECLTKEHCNSAAGDVCRADGTCGPHVGCVKDDDCKPSYCLYETGECVGCLEKDDCKNGQVCDLTAYYCRNCHDSQDCDGADCLNGSCANANECSNSLDCNGKACYLGHCTKCLDKRYCGKDEYCDVATGLCMAAQCHVGADCQEPLGCHDNQCLPCTEEKECRDGQICDGGRCVAGTAVTCNDSNGCQDGLVCLNNTCRPCTSTAQCKAPLTCDLSLSPARCVDPKITGQAVLGASCVSGADCQSGLCITLAGLSFCSQFCIGSNLGNTVGTGYQLQVDCPSGYQCHQGTAGGDLDGHYYCVAGAVLPDEPGYPFTSLPGSVCTAGNNSCQTSCDAVAGKCRRLCRADKDCQTGEACQAEKDTFGNPTGILSCSQRKASLLETGAVCSDNGQCQSGICKGYCYTADGYSTRLCNNNNDCNQGESCHGSCASACRSGADCTSGYVCTPWPLDPVTNGNWDGDLWVNVCDSPYFSFCSLDSHCDNNYKCDNAVNRCACANDDDCVSTTGVCIDGVCTTLAAGASCEEDANCASEWCSLGGKCTSICAVDADCYNHPAGHRCINTYYVSTSSGNNNTLYSIGLCDE